MKKIVLVFFVVLLVISMAGCMMGGKGDTYLGYSWSSAPLSIYDNNPSIPYTIYNGVYYRTSEGSFYMEYTAWDGSSWWMSYTIKANKGRFLASGDPAYFEISLYSFGPSLYKWDSPRGLDTTTQNTLQIQTEQRTIGDYTITIEYGSL